MFDLTFNGYIFARYRNPSVYLAKALGGYLMRIQLEIQLEPKRPEAPHVLIDHRLALSIDSAGQRLQIGKADADLKMWATPNAHSYPFSILYTLPLTRSQLLEIEVLRSSKPGPLVFDARLEGIALRTDRHETLQSTGSDGSFQVPVEHWLSQLRQCDFANKALFEIPLPIGTAQVIDASPGGYLTSAQTAFLNGQFEHCAMQCRRALEALTGKLGDGEDIRQLGKNGADRESLAVVDRIRILRRELTRIASVAGHTPPSGNVQDFELSRPEAALILASTAGVIAATNDNPA